MSDDVQAQEWPTHCESCGTRLQTGVVDVVGGADNEWEQGRAPTEVVAEDYCPNPDCSSRKGGTGGPAADDDHLHHQEGEATAANKPTGADDIGA